MSILCFTVGLVVGSSLGFVVSALCAANHMHDVYMSGGTEDDI